jgi:salicylate hydroxylase
VKAHAANTILGANTILIAGGGIGGLATALALARRNILSHVLERRQAFSEDGAGIQIGPNGTRILQHLGAAAHLQGLVATPDCLRVLDAETGRDLARLPLGGWMATRHGAPYWVAHRRDLHAALLTAAEAEPRIRISTGTAVVNAVETSQDLVAETDGGNYIDGRALVAADGLWSTLRGRCFAGAPPIYTGKTAARTVLPIDRVPHSLRSNEVRIWLAPGAHVVQYPVRAGRDMAIVAIFDEPEASTDWSTPCEARWIMDRSRGFPPLLRELLAEPDAWRKWSLHALSSLPRFAAGRIALLGDAAHPVLPFLAQGAVLALDDAVTLAERLANEKSVPAALSIYGEERRARAARVAAASRTNGRIYHQSGLMRLARNAALAIAPPARLMAGYDWLYGWKARGSLP